MDSSAEISQTIRYDPTLDEYKAFYDLSWAKQITTLVKGTELERAVLELKINWQSISDTHKMPWLCIDFLGRTWKVGFSEDSPAGGFKTKALKNIEEELLEKVRTCSKFQKPSTKKAVTKVLVLVNEIAASTAEKLEQSRQNFPREEFWRTLLDPALREMQMSIWGSQRLCYSALFHSYEEFLRHLFGVLKGDPHQQMPRFEDFDPVPIVGEEVGAFIMDDDVAMARLIRNALAHNGGRVTKKLKGRKHGIDVENGILQIGPKNTRRLFEILKGRALRLTEKAVVLLAAGNSKPMMTLEQLKDELNQVYEKQLQDLIINQHAFRHLDEAWKRTANDPKAVDLQNFIWQGYMAFACTAVRKMIDPNPTRSVSLRNFLVNLKSSLGSVSRAEYCARYSPTIPDDIRNRDYDEITGARPELTAEKIDEDLRLLAKVVEPIKGIVDTVIAHTDRTQRTATFNELNAAIEMLEATYLRYAQLVGCGSTNGLEYFDTLQDDIALVWPIPATGVGER